MRSAGYAHPVRAAASEGRSRAHASVAGAVRIQQRGRVRGLLLALWCLFILYGSFIPFRFSADPEVLRHKVEHVQVYPFVNGRKNFSVPDVVSNIALFVPLGALLATGSAGRGAPRGWWGLAATSAGWAFGFAAAIEIGQLFSPGRTASLLDVAANTAGAIGGATAAYVLIAAARSQPGARVVGLLRAEPLLVPLGLLALALAAGSFYPFAITLDVSTAWQNLKAGQWTPFGTFGRRFWGDLLVDKVVHFALLAGLAVQSIRHLHPRVAPAPRAWLATAGFAALLEAGKLLFAGRHPSVDNVMLAAVGGLIGATAIPLVLRSEPLRARAPWLLLILALALLAYAELRPFDFQMSAVAAKIRRIEWVPLVSYYRADPQRALFDLWQKLLLSGFLGCSVVWVRGRSARAAVGAGLLVGGLLEAAQLLTAARNTSLSDVMIFALGSGLGGAAYLRYRALQEESGGRCVAEAPRDGRAATNEIPERRGSC